MIRILWKFLAAISSNQQPGQVALSLVFGMILGLTPLLMPHNVLILLLIFILRINVSAVFVGWVVFTAISYLTDPLAHQIGLWVLQSDALQPMFIEWYNNAWWRITAFNNSLVMGSVILSYALSIPLFIAFLVLIRTYRKTFLIWINKFKVVQMLKAAGTAAKFTGRV